MAPEQIAESFTDSRKYRKPNHKKFVLNNDTYDFENFVLYHGSDFTVEQMQLYLVVENMPVLIGVAGISGGANRTSMLRLAAFDIDIPAQKSAEFMLRVKTKDPFVPDFVLEDRNSLYLDLQHENLAFGGFLGVAAVMVVFIGIFAYLLREPLFGWFTALALLLILNSLVEFGFRESIATMSLGGLSSKQILHLTRPFFIVLLAQIAFASGFSRDGRVANRPRLILMGLVANFVGISIARILGLGRYIDANIYSAFDGLMVASMIVFSVSAYDAKTRSARWFFPSLGLIFVASQCRWLTQLNVYRFDHHLIFLAPILEMGAIAVIVYGLILKIKVINSAKIAAEFEAGKNEVLKTLLRVVSHDINNSLTVAQAYAFKGSAIMAKEGHEEGQKYFSKILTACKNQSEIITNIRMLRAIEDGKTDIDLKSVPLIGVMQQVRNTFEDKLKAKNLELNYNSSEIAGIFVLAEPVSLNHSVINNLISNAIKFSHTNSCIDVMASMNGDEVRVTVRDFGVGMPSTLLEKVFMPNESTSRLGTSGEAGTGFGMPLVKSYMERYGGGVEISSESIEESPKNHGTSVTLYFKIPKSEPIAA
jgi:signal transduction histidine kinase